MMSPNSRASGFENQLSTSCGVEIFGEWVNGEIASEPLYDPKGERIRA